MRARCTLLLAATCCFAQQHATRTVPKKPYVDPQTGVKFSYPSVWVPYEKAPQYLPPQIADEGPADSRKPRASFVFSPVGNMYEHTTLLGLIFSYAALPLPSQTECLALGRSLANGDGKPKKLVISGTEFTEFDGGNAGMCHQQGTQIAVTYRKGQCLMFERDFNAMCSGVDDGKRDLTAQEERALQRHLDEAMQSVRVQP